MNEESTHDPNLEGLGGWLILVGIGVILGTLRMVFVSITSYVPLITDGTWEAVTDPSNEFYVSGLGTLLGVEVAVNTVIILASCYMVFLFFSKDRKFPKWFIGVSIFSLIFIVIDVFWGGLFFPEDPVFDPDTAREFGRSLIQCLVWVPYMLVSKRVAATFVDK